MTVQWIAFRVIQEIVRDRRTLLIFFLVPLLVMSLVYYSLVVEEIPKIGLIVKGATTAYQPVIASILEKQDNIELVTLPSSDHLEPDQLDSFIYDQLKRHRADGILLLKGTTGSDTAGGTTSPIHLYIEGSRPTLTASVLSVIAAVKQELLAMMPSFSDPSCPSTCQSPMPDESMALARHFLYGSEQYRTIDYFLPVFPPFFVFFFTFIISAVTFQRERVRGTLERLLIAPVSFTQVILGYIGGFFIFSTCQAAIILGFIISLLGFDLTIGQLFAIAVVTLVMMLISLILGLLASFLAANEFQALQFIPLVILPQLFLSDIIWSIESFPKVFQWISLVLPLTHANRMMRDLLVKGLALWQSWPEMLVMLGFFLFFLVLLILAARHQQRSA